MTQKFKQMCEVYKIFAADWNCDLSHEAMEELYNYETFGKGDLGAAVFSSRLPNGYAVGKKWLNVTVSMWLDDARGIVNGGRPLMNIPECLYQDNKFPKWWLDSIFKNK